MVKVLHTILICTFLAGAEMQYNDPPDFVFGHNDIHDHPPHSEFVDSAPTHRHHHRTFDGVPFDDFSPNKRRLLRSDLGKRLYEAFDQEDIADSSPGVASVAEAVKRSDEDFWKQWLIKESKKKRPMLRQDMGKRQMIRSDLG